MGIGDVDRAMSYEFHSVHIRLSARTEKKDSVASSISSNVWNL
jgi:hypothetical protein